MNGLVWQLRDLSFAHPGQEKLLRGLSLSIDAADRILLRGANGSGKSTLLALLMGILSPVSGSLELWGKSPAGLNARSFKDLVYCRQSASANLFGLVPRHDLETWQLAWPGRFAEEQFAALDSDLLGKLDTPYARLSGGELRAFSLLWLPLLRDKFWLLDEPTAGLDARRKEGFIRLCEEKRAGEAGFLIVSHDPAWPESLFDRVLLLEDGSLKEL